MEHQSVSSMWNQYLNTLPSEKQKDMEYTSWHFSNNEKSANYLVELVKSGVKTATSSLFLFYELEGEELPKAGNLNIITDWDGVAQVMTETFSVRVIPFQDVSEGFASKEGEGDRTLNFWRAVHQEFFEKELSELGKAFSQDMLVVCEEFKVVYGVGQ